MRACRRNLLALVMLSAVIATSSLPAFADVMVSIQPSFSTPSVGSFFDIFVNIDSVDDLYAFQFDVNFNPAILQATSLSEGSFLPAGGETFFIPGTIDNPGGSIAFTADSLLGPDPGVTGSGHLAVLSFKALGQGTSPISLSNLVLLDSSLSEIAFTSNDGSVNVSVSAVPEPTTMLLLALGLVGLAGFKRKLSM